MLKANQALNKILIHARENDKWVPLQNLHSFGLHDRVSWGEAADQGMVHLRNNKGRGYEVNLSLKGYHHLNSLRN